jgi:hypothetical protein
MQMQMQTSAQRPPSSSIGYVMPAPQFARACATGAIHTREPFIVAVVLDFW